MPGNKELATQIDGFIQFTLMRGCDDWVDACEIVDNIFNLDPMFHARVSKTILDGIVFVEKTGGIEEFVFAKDLSHLIIEKLLNEELMIIGDVYDSFVPWGVTVEDALKIVDRKWDELNGRLPGLGEYWLCNTPKGDEIGKEVLLEWNIQRCGSAEAPGADSRFQEAMKN
jgi:hypothetical protein